MADTWPLNVRTLILTFQRREMPAGMQEMRRFLGGKEMHAASEP